jgi:hypothetical protein
MGLLGFDSHLWWHLSEPKRTLLLATEPSGRGEIMRHLGIVFVCISLLAGCARTTTAPQATPSGTPVVPLLANVHSTSTVLFAGHRVPNVVVTEAQWDALLANPGNRQTLGYITLGPLDSRQVASTNSAGPPPRAIGRRRCHYRYLVLNDPEFLLATGIHSPFGGVIIISRC